MFRHVKFAELPVVDQDRAARFYRDKIGLKVVVDTPYETDWRWLEFEVPGAATKILVTRREGEPRREPAIILVAGDVQRAYEALTSKGVEFTQPPTAAPWSSAETYALFRDTEGNTVMIGSH
jgi:predicted enzyme related to lactoylglutathione lyase